jgi:threonine/homoserine/homoserine lactone efflux protein
MFGTQDLPIFIVSGLLLNIAPGPDSLFIVTRSATQGWRAGSIAALGIGSGTFVHIFAAALGVSAILATSSVAFSVLKIIGAAYLAYVGIRLLFSNHVSLDQNPKPASEIYAMSYRKIYIQGFLTNVLNPKMAIFFLAFVPQFISPDAINKSTAFILLGCIFNFNGMLWCHFLAITTAFASKRIRINNLVALWLNRLIGAVFVSLGIKLACAQQH